MLLRVFNSIIISSSLLPFYGWSTCVLFFLLPCFLNHQVLRLTQKGPTLLLLWQALASERELVLVLLDPDAVVDTGPTARRFSKGSETDLGKTETDLTFVLDRIFEGVCRPFKVRVEQVLQSQPSIIISYKLSNTLEFYSYTVSARIIYWMSRLLFEIFLLVN